MGYDWDQFNKAVQSESFLGIPRYGTAGVEFRKSGGVQGQTLDYDLNPEKILSNMPGRSWTGGAKTGKGEGLVFDLNNDTALQEYANKHGIVRLEQDDAGNITPYFKNKRSARIFNELKVKAMDDLVKNKEMTFANRGDDTYVSTAENRLRNKAKTADDEMDVKDFYKKIILQTAPPAVGSPEWEKWKEWQLELDDRRRLQRREDLISAKNWADQKGATNVVAKILKSFV